MKYIKNITRTLLFVLLAFFTFNIISAFADSVVFKITDISVKDKSSGTTVNTLELDDGSVANNILFDGVNDYITYKIDLKNTDSEDYTIKSVTDDNTSENLKYTYSTISNLTVGGGETKSFDLTITYIKQATSPTLTTDPVTLTITYEKADGEEVKEDVTPSINTSINDGNTKVISDTSSNLSNPKTNDNVIVYFILSGVCVVGLILTSKLKRKNLYMYVAVLTLIPVCVYASTIKFTLILDNTIKTKSNLVTIDLGDGTTPIVIDLANGATLGSIDEPTKRGYKFDGWTINGEPFTSSTPVTSAVTLEPSFTIETYEINYDLGGGVVSEDNPTEYNVNSDITLHNPTKVGHDFVGWQEVGTDNISDNVRIEDEVGNKSYVAVFTPKKFTVSFDPDNGSSAKEVKVDYGTKVSPISNPYKEGFTFSYWKLGNEQFDFENTVIEGDITLVAVYNPSGDTAYTVYHRYRHLNDDGFDTTTENLTGVTGDTVELAFKPKTGFTNPLNHKSLTILPDGSASEEYIYERESIKFNINYSDNDVTASHESDSYSYGTSITLTAHDKEGFTFDGWSNGETANPYTFTLTEDVTIEPVYTPIRYEVTFDTDNGQASQSVKVDYNSTVSRPNQDPEKEGYDFVGWYLGNEEFDFNEPITDDTVLVAHYDLISYNIYYEVTSSGTQGNPITVADLYSGEYPTSYTVNDNFTLPIPDIDIPGYDFVGFVDLNEDNQSYALAFLTDNLTISNSTGDKYIYILHSPKNDTPYTVRYNYETIDGTGFEMSNPSLEYSGTKFETRYTETFTGQTGATISPSEHNIHPLYGFTLLSSGSGCRKCVVTNDTIAADGSTVMDLYYARNNYQFSYNDSSSVTSSKQSGSYKYGTEITLTANNEKDGHAFLHWSDGETSNPYTFELVNNTYISPVYDDTTYTVSYVTGTNEAIASKTVNAGNYAPRPSVDPSKEGYQFSGWTLNGEPYSFNTPVESDITLTATYTPISYRFTVVFEYKGYIVDRSGDYYTIESNIDFNELMTTALPRRVPGFNVDYYTIGNDDTHYDNIHIQNQTGDVTYVAHLKAKEFTDIICKRATTLNTATCNSTNSGNACLASYDSGDTITYGRLGDSTTFKVGDAFDCNVAGNGYDTRFYYLRNSNQRAVLIANNNSVGNGILNSTQESAYYDSLDFLPNKIYTWLNVPGPTGEWYYMAARPITIADLSAMRGNASIDELKQAGSLDKVNFLFENLGLYTSDEGISRNWLFEDVVDNNTVYYVYNAVTRNIEEVSYEDIDNYTEMGGMRPVIEIPLSRMDLTVPSGN
ncbi:MAG: InlB B-repeat-containing protein [Bacilli bacterium]|nr:InlB B-repeat-containing protein [Bacilli bacterium]